MFQAQTKTRFSLACNITARHCKCSNTNPPPGVFFNRTQQSFWHSNHRSFLFTYFTVVSPDVLMPSHLVLIFLCHPWVWKVHTEDEPRIVFLVCFCRCECRHRRVYNVQCNLCSVTSISLLVMKRSTTFLRLSVYA